MAHKKHADGGGGVNLNIIITPMLDMAFQLMAFFIMTYHPSALEGHIDGTLLPPSKVAIAGKASAPTEDIPVSELPDVQDSLLVNVKAVGRGQIEGDRVEGMPSRFEIRRPEDGAQSRILGGPPLTLDEGMKTLEKELKSMRTAEGGKASKTSIKLEGDPEIRHQYVMRVYDICKTAGFDKIHFVAPIGVK